MYVFVEIFILGEPRSVDDLSTLPYDNPPRQIHQTTAAHEADDEDDQQLRKTVTHINHKDGRTSELVCIQRDVGASCSRA